MKIFILDSLNSKIAEDFYYSLLVIVSDYDSSVLLKLNIILQIYINMNTQVYTSISTELLKRPVWLLFANNLLSDSDDHIVLNAVAN